MPKWQKRMGVNLEFDRWMYLFTQGENIGCENPPEILNTKEFRPVMETLKEFVENEKDYLLYESRRIAQMQAVTEKEHKERMANEIRQLSSEYNKISSDYKKVTSDYEKAVDENERLRSLLKQAGINPDHV